MKVLEILLVEIAEQKAGIIKENSETVFALSEENDVNENKANLFEKHNKLHVQKKKKILKL